MMSGVANGNFIRIATAISTTGCGVATLVEATEDDPRRLDFNTFQAEIHETVKAIGEATAHLIGTGEEVEVDHFFKDVPMVADEILVIAQTSERRWVTIFWECTDG